MKPLKVLNLYAGIGGNRKLWQNVEVTAVELYADIAKIYQDFYPDDKVIVDDAHEYLLKHFKEYDFIWTSPPCPTHSDIRRMALDVGKYDNYLYPDMALYQEIIFLQHFAKGYWVVENVRPYYTPLIPPSVEMHRHYFWCNFAVQPYKVIDKRNHHEVGNNTILYGYDLSRYKFKDKRKIIRNMVNPEVGVHFLNSARHDFPPIQEGLFSELQEQKHA